MRTIVITGGAGGLGVAVTRKFLELGDHVFVPVTSTAQGDQLLEAIDERHHDLLELFVADMMDEKSVEKFYTFGPAKQKSLDALVHLIGGIKPWTTIAKTNLDDWDFVMSLNLRSAFLNARAAMRLMTPQKRGSIVMMSAMTALHPEAAKAAYVAAKSGIIALMRVLAIEGKPLNITANAIAPSVIRTAANLEWAKKNEAEKWVTPEELAATIAFLCSPDARSITGSVIHAEGRVE